MNGLHTHGSMPRRKRERRALRLIATGGIASVVAIVRLVAILSPDARMSRE
jgi:hypothetical protein